MMWWNGSSSWAWWMMAPMMVLMMLVIGGLILWVVMPRARSRSDRPSSPVERLDERLAAGDISVEEYRARQAELEHSG